MDVLYLTIFLSIALVVIFVVGFLYHSLRSSGDPLRDSLLPFHRDQVKPHPAPEAASRRRADSHL